jgi:hypothetical protein
LLGGSVCPALTFALGHDLMVGSDSGSLHTLAFYAATLLAVAWPLTCRIKFSSGPSHGAIKTDRQFLSLDSVYLTSMSLSWFSTTRNLNAGVVTIELHRCDVCARLSPRTKRTDTLPVRSAPVQTACPGPLQDAQALPGAVAILVYPEESWRQRSAGVAPDGPAR